MMTDTCTCNQDIFQIQHSIVDSQGVRAKNQGSHYIIQKRASLLTTKNFVTSSLNMQQHRRFAHLTQARPVGGPRAAKFGIREKHFELPCRVRLARNFHVTLLQTYKLGVVVATSSRRFWFWDVRSRCFFVSKK